MKARPENVSIIRLFMKKCFLWMTAMAFVAALWTGCEDDKGGETPPPPPTETALSNLNGNVALPEIESARLDYRPELSTARTDTYFLTLSVSMLRSGPVGAFGSS